MDASANTTRKRKNSEEEHSRSDLRPPPGLTMNSSSITAGGDVNLHFQSKCSTPDSDTLDDLSLWLSPRNQHVIHKDVFDKVMPGTGEWVFEEPSVKDWLAGTKKLVWGTGIPGAGKTCLSSIIINHLMHVKNAPVIFLYCQYKDQPSIKEVLSCLLRQLVESSDEAAKTVQDTLYASCQKTKTLPSHSELVKTLKGICSKFTNIFLVVDALDELADKTRGELVSELVKLKLPLLITSRPLPNLLDLPESDFTIQAPNDDFHAFISDRLKQNMKLRPFLCDSRIHDEIRCKIQAKCDGMFLLASLLVDTLASGHIINLCSLRKAASELPDTLNDIYQVTLDRIGSQSVEQCGLAFQALMWITYATRPLEVAELVEALSANDRSGPINDEHRIPAEVIVSTCLGLITIEQESGTIKLIHFTVQEFFDDYKSQIFKTPHALIANRCAIYLTHVDADLKSVEDEWNPRQYIYSSPLVSYSLKNLGYHVYQASTSGCSFKPDTLMALFSRKGTLPMLLPTLKKSCCSWTRKYALGYAVHFAAVNNLPAICEVLCKDLSTDVNIRAENGMTALQIACYKGYINIAQCFLSSPNIDVNARDNDGRTSLHYAARYGSAAALEALLSSSNIDVYAKDTYGWNSLNYAARYGHISALEVLLHAFNIDVYAKDTYGCTLLHYAVRYGHVSALQQLLHAFNIDVNARDKGGWTCLHYAVAYNHTSALQLLLSSSTIDVNAKDTHGCTPLHWAVRNNHTSALQLLLSSPNIDINARDKDGWTSLHKAACWGRADAVRSLLKVSGIEVHVQAVRQHFGTVTPLQLAQIAGYTHIVTLF